MKTIKRVENRQKNQAVLLQKGIHIITNRRNNYFMIKGIRKIVKEGYEKGDYVSHFRTNSQPNKMEKNSWIA